MRFFLALFLLAFSALAQVPSEPVKAGPWVRLEGCSLVPWESNDGDSFKIRTASGEEFVARLYFVDAPETSLEFSDRVQEQAEEMGISVPRALELAGEATSFTKDALGKPFTVHTRWRLGGGRGTRWAVMIQRADGKWLCEEMVKAGLARIHGIRTPPPDETGAEDSRAWLARLEEVEGQAKAAKLGGWR